MKKLKIAGIVLILFILYVIIGMLVPFVHMKSVSQTNKSKIHTESFIQEQIRTDQTEQRS